MKKTAFLFIGLITIICIIILIILFPKCSIQTTKSDSNCVPVRADAGGNILHLIGDPQTNDDKVILYVKETKGLPINVTSAVFGGTHTFSINSNAYWCDISNYSSALTDYLVKLNAVNPGDPNWQLEHGEAFICLASPSSEPSDLNIKLPDVLNSMTFTPNFAGVNNETYYFYEINKLSAETNISIQEDYEFIDAAGRLNHIPITHVIGDKKIIFLHYKPLITRNYKLILLNGIVEIKVLKRNL